MPGGRGAGSSSQAGARRSAADGWRACGASVPGTEHRRAGQECQDFHDWLPLAEGSLAAAVADGAGSAAQGGRGAELAARTALATLRAGAAERPAPADCVAWGEALRRALAEARGALEVEADRHGLEARDLATTLIVAVATRELVAVAQVGDGAVVAAGERGEIVGLTRPQHGEYVNQTTFLSAPEALETAQVATQRDRFRHLALFTDGLERLALKMPRGTPHAAFFEPVFRFAAEQDDAGEGGRRLATFLGSPRVARRAHDDLTLLLATRGLDEADGDPEAQDDGPDAEAATGSRRGD